jgi:flagellar biosynthesis protein
MDSTFPDREPSGARREPSALDRELVADDRHPDSGSASATPKLRKAVALHYDPEGSSVPQVVATGKGRLADRIIEIARERGIAIREDPDLVELLARLDVDRHIPEQLFPAVAELLAFVYRVNRQAAERQPDASPADRR